MTEQQAKELIGRTFYVALEQPDGEMKLQVIQPTGYLKCGNAWQDRFGVIESKNPKRILPEHYLQFETEEDALESYVQHLRDRIEDVSEEIDGLHEHSHRLEVKKDAILTMLQKLPVKK